MPLELNWDETNEDDKVIVYHPRNNFVIVEVRLKTSIRGVQVPEISAEAQEHVVYAVGPKVENLKKGDRVLMVGKKGESWSPIPRAKNLIITAEENIVLTYEKVPVEPDPPAPKRKGKKDGE